MSPTAIAQPVPVPMPMPGPTTASTGVLTSTSAVSQMLRIRNIAASLSRAVPPPVTRASSVSQQRPAVASPVAAAQAQRAPPLMLAPLSGDHNMPTVIPVAPYAAAGPMPPVPLPRRSNSPLAGSGGPRSAAATPVYGVAQQDAEQHPSTQAQAAAAAWEAIQRVVGRQGTAASSTGISGGVMMSPQVASARLPGGIARAVPSVAMPMTQASTAGEVPSTERLEGANGSSIYGTPSPSSVNIGDSRSWV
jgi:hypothetical protein